MKILIVALCAALLAGCSTMGMTPEQVAARDQGTCSSYGFKAGTDAFAACMMQLDQQRKADDSARIRRMADSFTNSFNRPTTTCTTTASSFGNYGNATTTCR